MDWEITATQNEEAWFSDYVVDMLSHVPRPLPLNDQKFGHVETHWHQVRPGVAFIAANPDTGTTDDQLLAESIVYAQLVHHGFKRATIDHDAMRRESTYADVQAKARRLIQSGNVTILRNGYNVVLGQVQGDHGMYETTIKRDDPSNRSITGSHCDCDWGQFQNRLRTRQWKKYQDRMCAHLLATQWQAAATPLDEDRAPGNFGQPGQMAFPGMGGPMQAPSQMPTMQNSPFASPNAWFNQPAGESFGTPLESPQNALQDPSGGSAGMQAPSPESALPQFPMDPSMQPQVNPASTPGGNPGPTPTNPIQYPGGTFSKVAVEQMYQNGDLVELLNDDMGTQQGRSEAHGAGQPVSIPKGQVGEVLGTHPTTNMVNVLYMGSPWDKNGPMMPYGATAWHWPSDLKPRPDIKAPGPALRRVRGPV